MKINKVFYLNFFICLVHPCRSNLKRFGTPTEVLKSVYCSYVRPSLEYACLAWHPGLTKDQTDRLETIQKRALKIILGQNYST